MMGLTFLKPEAHWYQPCMKSGRKTTPDTNTVQRRLMGPASCWDKEEMAKLESDVEKNGKHMLKWVAEKRVYDDIYAMRPGLGLIAHSLCAFTGNIPPDRLELQRRGGLPSDQHDSVSTRKEARSGDRSAWGRTARILADQFGQGLASVDGSESPEFSAWFCGATVSGYGRRAF
ncbi:hypothetical protein Bbelb_364600 [Branchiostoma belcheri]|nr:hypothetical protein Bbelb_364600 [Branchiostoma belcheri]